MRDLTRYDYLKLFIWDVAFFLRVFMLINAARG